MKTTPTNLLIIVVSLVGLIVGLYRTFPVKLDTKFLASFAPLWIMFGITVTMVLYEKGVGGAIAGTDASVRAASAFLPTMLGFFLVMGFGSVLVECYRPQIIGLMSANNAQFSILGISLILPSPTTVAREIQGFWITAPQTRSNLILLFLSSSMLSLPIFYLRTMGMEWELQWKMFVASFAETVLLIPILWVMDHSIGIR